LKHICTVSSSNVRLNCKVGAARITVMEPFAAFLAVAVVALLVPGPDTFVVLRTAVCDGPRAGRWAAAGAGAGNVVWGVASAVGVAGLLAASGSAFGVLKLAGAAYLAVLGAQALLAAARGGPLVPDDGGAARGASPATAFRRGLASDLLNVKVGLFWTALVPQFAGPGASALLPAAMVATMGALAFAWLTAYAHLAARLRRTLARPRCARVLNTTAGVVFAGLGARLALVHR
jgi:threonine/homoserine/homoserine lactone efflux protein